MNALALATLTFLIIKGIFLGIQWLSESKDKILRGHLDLIFDHLDKLSFRQISVRLLRRTYKALKLFYSPSRKFILITALAIIFINIGGYALESWIFCFAQNECDSTLGHNDTLASEGWRKLSTWLFAVLVGSTIFQLISLVLTLILLRRAATRPGRPVFIQHIGGTIFILAATVCMLYLVQIISTSFVFHNGPYWNRIIPNILHLKIYFVATFAMALVVALPSLMYFLMLINLTALRFSPAWLRRAFLWLIFRITTDKTPVLERIGSFFGGLGAITSAIVTYLKLN